MMIGKAKERQPNEPGLAGVKHIIAVASGKGGVGKSTVASNLAVALKQTGASVGLMDADIYGPSQPGMMGSQERPGVGQDYITPTEHHGVHFVSMGLLMPDDGPVIWRAPMATKMIQQFIGSVLWGELDYLLIDLPPGTGDVQLTLAQQAQLSGAVIVTTPQEVSLGVARKGLRMFEQVKVPIIGVIENMSGFVCAHCGKETAIFKTGGGRKLAAGAGVPFLGSLPLDPEFMISGEEGKPVLLRDKESPAASAIVEVAGKLNESLEHIEATIGKDEPVNVDFPSPNELSVTWSDGETSSYDAYNLRINCTCAACVNEDTGKRMLDPKQVPLDISYKGCSPVGRYGLSINFSDGHNTGIYTYQRLRALSTRQQSQEGFSV